MAGISERRGALAPIDKRRSLRLGEPKTKPPLELPSLGKGFGSLPSVKELGGIGEVLRRGYR